MKKIVYDCESFNNYFCIVFSELHGDGKVVFEISKNRQDHKHIIIQILNYWLLGYNNHGYDDIVCNFILDNPECTAEEINVLSQAIIALGKDPKNEELKAIVKPYKHDNYFKSSDIMTMLASSKLRVSLKHLQVIIKWHNLEEFECDWKKDLPEDRWEACKLYCLNDVLSLKAVCHNQEKGFALRDYVHEQTGFDVYSKDPVKIAEWTMADSIAKGLGWEDTQRFIWDTNKKNIPIRTIKLSELILPFISFKTKVFQDVLDVYNNFLLNPKEEADKKKADKFKIPALVDGMILNFGLGGLHHDYKAGRVFKSTDTVKVIQSDVTSYYPSMRIEHFPHRFDPVFLKEYVKAYEEKATGKSTKNKLLEGYAKLKLNSVFGLYNSVYSPLYSPKLAYSTTINGQLMLAMLIEELILAGFKVIGANTDAVNVLVPNNKWDEYQAICTAWEKKTSMGLDHDVFTAIYEQSCNNYIAVEESGKIKTKGTFVPELELLKGYKYPVIKTALLKYFTEGVALEDTIRNHDDIYDFCMSTKMGKSNKTGAMFEAYHNGVKLQRTNRYFASKGKETAYLYKCAGLVNEHVLADSGVTIFNKFIKKEMKDYGINYDFYIRQARKVQQEIEPEQLSLF